MIAEDNDRSSEIDGPPPLPLNLREHKLHIFIFWGVILLTSCIAPLVLYPSLHWGADLSLKICSCGPYLPEKKFTFSFVSFTDLKNF